MIYPPVDVSRFARKTTDYRLQTTAKKTVDGRQSTVDQNYFLVVSRLVASKNVDVAVEVCAKLNLPLKVVGVGKEEGRLRQMAKGSSVEVLGEVDDKKLAELYQNCRAVIFPASQEDFGLVPVEAMAAGKPVIANAEGGVLETVVDKKTGVYFDPATPGSLTLAINNFVDLEKKGTFDAKFIQNHAKKFGKDRFKKEILEFVKGKIK